MRLAVRARCVTRARATREACALGAGCGAGSLRGAVGRTARGTSSARGRSCWLTPDDRAGAAGFALVGAGAVGRVAFAPRTNITSAVLAVVCDLRAAGVWRVAVDFFAISSLSFPQATLRAAMQARYA